MRKNDENDKSNAKHNAGVGPLARGQRGESLFLRPPSSLLPLKNPHFSSHWECARVRIYLLCNESLMLFSLWSPARGKTRALLYSGPEARTLDSFLSLPTIALQFTWTMPSPANRERIFYIVSVFLRFRVS